LLKVGRRLIGLGGGVLFFFFFFFFIIIIFLRAGLCVGCNRFAGFCFYIFIFFLLNKGRVTKMVWFWSSNGSG
jgi:hypothetical protein